MAREHYAAERALGTELLRYVDLEIVELDDAAVVYLVVALALWRQRGLGWDKIRHVLASIMFTTDVFNTVETARGVLEQLAAERGS